jgi:hypothetical protein
VDAAPFTKVSVAWRGMSGVAREVSTHAIVCASGPLSRTTPTPPLPGGVATAMMVSSVENTEVEVNTAQSTARHHESHYQDWRVTSLLAVNRHL